MILIPNDKPGRGWFPKMNSFAEVVSSGLNEVYALGKKINNGYNPAWVSNDEIVYGSDSPIGGISRIQNIRTGEFHDVPTAYNNYVGNVNGLWAGVSPALVEVYRGTEKISSVGGAGNPVLSANGRFGYTTDYFKSNHQFVVDGTVVTQGVIMEVALTDKHVAWVVATGMYERDVYVDGQKVNLDGTEQHVWLFDDWVMTTFSGGYRIRPIGETHGYIWLTNNAYNPDVRMIGDQITAVASDERGDLFIFQIDTRSARVDLQTLTLPTVIYGPLWFGFFEFIPADLPGNCVLDVTTKLLVTKKGDIIAQYVDAELEGNTPEAYAQKIAEARVKRPHVPVIAYWPDGVKDVPPADWVGVEGYRYRDESMEVFEQRLQTAISRCKKVFLIPQCYTSNDKKTMDLLSIVPVTNRLAQKNLNVIAVVPFSGSGRPSGLQDHPEVLPLWQQFASQLQTPVIQDVVIMQSPRITITQYSPQSGPAPLRVRAVYATEPNSGPIDKLLWLIRKVGAADWQVAAINYADDPDHTYVIKEAGTWEIKLKAIGPGGEWETQSQRIIKVATNTPVPAPQPVPVPQPPPPPAPTPQDEENVALPEYVDFVHAEGDELFATWLQKHPKPGNPPLGTMLQWAWRRLAENWSQANIKRAILDQNTIGLVQKVREWPGTPDYPTFIDVEGPAMEAAYRQATGHAPGHSDIRHMAWRRLNAGWTLDNILKDVAGQPNEGPTLPRVIHTHTQTINGRLQASGRLVVNDNGIFRLRGVSALALCMHSDGEITDYLDWAADKNFNEVRIFAGNLPWKGQVTDYARSRLPFICEQAGQRGLYVGITPLTDTGDGPAFDKREHVRLIGEICARYENTFIDEVANEYWHPTQDGEVHDPDYLLRLRREVIPAGIMTALGAPNTDEPTPASIPQLGQTNIIAIHQDRSRDKWNMIRRVRELAAVSEAYGKAVLNNEPIGADDNAENGRRENDPAIFFTLGILNRLFEVGGVFHSQAGLHANSYSPQQQACAEAFVAGSTLIKTPARMIFKNSGWGDSPIKSAAFDTAITRVYSGLAEDGSENVAVLVGLRRDPDKPENWLDPRVETQNGWRLGETLGEMPGVKVLRLVR